MKQLLTLVVLGWITFNSLLPLWIERKYSAVWIHLEHQLEKRDPMKKRMDNLLVSLEQLNSHKCDHGTNTDSEVVL